MANTVTVEIAGRVYTIKTDQNPKHVANLADAVTSKILEIKRDSGASQLDCATVAALIFAHEAQKYGDT